MHVESIEEYYTYQGKWQKWSVNPQGPNTGIYKVSRGGLYDTNPAKDDYLRVKQRCYNKPNTAYPGRIGFRLACE